MSYSNYHTLSVKVDPYLLNAIEDERYVIQMKRSTFIRKCIIHFLKDHGKSPNAIAYDDYEFEDYGDEDEY